MKKGFILHLILLLTAGMVACSDKNAPDNPGTSGTGSDTAAAVTPTDTTITTADTIRISWSGANATIVGTHDGVSVTQQDGYVQVVSTVKDVTYILSGTGTGSIRIEGTNRHQLILSDLTLTCSDGPAINNQCKKSCFVLLQGTNSLTDGATYADSSEDRKAAFFSEGQIIVSGSGTLEVKGNYKHAIASDDYIQFAESTGSLTLKAAADGIHANDGIYFDGGTFTIHAGNDGVQCDSIIIINGGAMNITATDKGIVDSLGIAINGGTVRVTSEYKCIKTKANLHISGGDIQVICTGVSSGGGWGGGWGGNSSSSSPEGIEAKGTITITGGQVYSQSNDDAINAGGDLTIEGGCVCAYSTGNDGIDANGNCYIKGGVVYAISASSPEVGIDANSEGGKKLYVQGGTLVAIGGLESGSTLTQACYSASSWSKNTWYVLTSGEEVFAFKTPSGGGSTLVVSGAVTPTLKSGVTASGTAIFNNTAFYPASATGGSNVTLSSYSGGNGGPGGGGHGGGGRPW